MAKQTAVEWLYEQLYKDGHFGINTRFAEVNELVSIAKAVEKEQMCDFYVEGCEDTYGIDEEGQEGSDRKSAITLYNETFKGGEDGSTD